MKKSVALIIVLLIFLAGCAQKVPEVVCNAPYMRHGEGCCMDQNSNSICDDDEDVMFEPKYAPSDEPDDSPVQDMDYDLLYNPESAEQEEEPETVEPVKETKAAEPVKSAYVAPPPKITGWEDENDFMSMKVTGMVIDVDDVTPVNKVAPDKEAYLKEIDLEIKNKEYNFLVPKMILNFQDERDPIIIQETIICFQDDIETEGCNRALPVAETMNVKLLMDRRIPRLDMDKTLKITLQNRRDDKEANILKVEQTHDILDIVGAKYI